LASILVTLGSHLSQSPRAQRVVTLISQQRSHDLIISYPKLNALFSSDDAEIAKRLNLELIPFCDLTHQSLSRLVDRARFKLGRSAARWLQWSTPWALGYGSTRALNIAKHIKPVFHYGFNEVGSYISYKLLGCCRVAADFEDYYSQDLLPLARLERPLGLLVHVESQLCKHADLVTTASDELSLAFKDAYQGVAPYVVYNMFPPKAISCSVSTSHLPTPSDEALNAVWFSKSVGPGRGLEELCEAMSGGLFQNPIHLYVIGSCSEQYKVVLQSYFRKEDHLSAVSCNRICFVPFLSPAELDSYLPRFDIGLALERPTPLSRNLTVTYKFFSYLSAGLPIVASPTSGQIEGASLCPSAVVLADGFTASDIVNALRQFSKSDVEELRKECIKCSKKSCNRQTYDDTLLEEIMRACGISSN
jgi:glycosyltransferase involved in cell wall biosynthesis